MHAPVEERKKRKTIERIIEEAWGKTRANVDLSAFWTHEGIMDFIEDELDQWGEDMKREVEEKIIHVISKKTNEIDKITQTGAEADRILKKRREAREKYVEQIEAYKEQYKLEKKEIDNHISQLQCELENLLFMKKKYADLPPIDYHKYEYFPPPPPICPVSLEMVMPTTSGIYFLWESEVIVYIGQAANFYNRCRLGTHHAMRDGDYISWLEYPLHMLNYAEYFYIGAIRPVRNFGLRKIGKEE